jgi:hypothetical protein
MKRSYVALVILGVVLSISGIVLRVLVDGNLVQIPVCILVFGGLALVFFAVQKGRNNNA